jgi:phosphoribosylamine---glycine ligase
MLMTESDNKPSILIVGKDARTHALAAACAVSPQEPRLFGLSEMAIPGLASECVKLITTDSLNDTSVIGPVVEEAHPDLAIIGPEEPLAAGYADRLEAMGIPTFGPVQQLAAIESSKSWARQLLDSHGIPGNPEHRLFRSDVGLAAYLRELGSFVIKPDGLTGGKGVRVHGDHFTTLDEGLDYARHLLGADGYVQIEEKLVGEEFSLMTITDGRTHIHCPPVQDHKRAFEADKGLNTGGMGSYSCADHSLPFLDSSDLAEAQAINEQVITALERETGQRYRGVLYGGFIVTRENVRLIEYNCRFGDPEAMNILPLLQADFVEIASKAAVGKLAEAACSFAARATVCKYVVPAAYPGPSPAGEPILVPQDLQDGRGSVRWYWAACRQEDSRTVMSGSRAGAAVGIGDTLDEAEQIAEEAVLRVGGNVRHRRDIGRRELISRRVEHMAELRGLPV